MKPQLSSRMIQRLVNRLIVRNYRFRMVRPLFSVFFPPHRRTNGKTAWPWDYGRFEAEKFCRFHRWPFSYETFPLKLSMYNTCRSLRKDSLRNFSSESAIFLNPVATLLIYEIFPIRNFLIHVPWHTQGSPTSIIMIVYTKHEWFRTSITILGTYKSLQPHLNPPG